MKTRTVRGGRSVIVCRCQVVEVLLALNEFQLVLSVSCGYFLRASGILGEHQTLALAVRIALSAFCAVGTQKGFEVKEVMFVHIAQSPLLYYRCVILR